jgi:hypothetical protein
LPFLAQKRQYLMKMLRVLNLTTNQSHNIHSWVLLLAGFLNRSRSDFLSTQQISFMGNRFLIWEIDFYFRKGLLQTGLILGINTPVGQIFEGIIFA